MLGVTLVVGLGCVLKWQVLGASIGLALGTLTFLTSGVLFCRAALSRSTPLPGKNGKLDPLSPLELEELTGATDRLGK